uniref:Uncharacterized protein n=1 Tax=Anguilla anguilla TaxID=7936 RepID=A0A0E9TU29_ANGAN
MVPLAQNHSTGTVITFKNNPCLSNFEALLF